MPVRLADTALQADARRRRFAAFLMDLPMWLHRGMNKCRHRSARKFKMRLTFPTFSTRWRYTLRAPTQKHWSMQPTGWPVIAGYGAKMRHPHGEQHGGAH